MPRKVGVLFKGNFFGMSLVQMQKSRKFEKGVLKPTAVRNVKKGKKVYSQFYHKPFTYEEGL